jgi:RTX calcium-binding nonapeptide repeat (4 copies)
VPPLTIMGTPIADNLDDLGPGVHFINTGLGNDVITGGPGNDTIVAGPESVAKLATTTVTLTGYGLTADGVGAQAQLLVNGKVASDLLEFKPATDPSGYQTFTITFANSEAITGLDISLANSTPGRSLHLKEISVNGVKLTPSQGTNASSPGTFDLYVHTIRFDTTNDQAWFTGTSTDNDLVHGGAGDDVITGGAGIDYIDGGAGTDTAVFAGNISDYIISVVGNQVVVTDKVAGRDGTDYLANIELLKFANTTISTPSLAPNHTELTVPGLRRAEAGDSQSIHSDGSINHVEYDRDGHLVQFATRHADGSFDQFTFDTSGNETGETTCHPDGSRDGYDHDFTGQNGISQHVTADASGHGTLTEQFHTDGTLALKQAVNANGVKTLDQYDSLGHIAEEIVTQTDGAYVRSSYASDGALIAKTTRRADGSRDVDTWDVTRQVYSVRHDVIDASGRTVATTLDNDDGSHTMTADAAGVTLTSTVVNDIMNGAGGDTFVFNQVSGNVVINNFEAGDAAGHDIIQISSSLVTDLAHLTTKVVGNDTVIELGHDASITLIGVVTPLTAHDVLIV